MSVTNYATAETIKCVVDGEIVPARSAAADKVAHALSLSVNGRAAGSFDGSEEVSLDIQTATAIVERLSELPEAGETSADIVGLENETCVKQKSGDAYSYASVIVRDTDKIAVGKSAEAPAMNSISVGVQAICSGINGISIGRKSAATITEALAIGSAAMAKQINSIAVGKGALAEGDAAVAVGKVAHATAANSIALGQGATADTANTICLGNDKIAALNCQVDLSVTSDERDKADIEELDKEKALEFIGRVQAVRYVNNRRSYYAEEGKKYDREAHGRGEKKGKRKRVGVLAQQVQKELFRLFRTDNFADIVNDDLYDAPERKGTEENLLTVRYSAFIPFLIASVQALCERVRILEEKIVDKSAQK